MRTWKVWLLCPLCGTIWDEIISYSPGSRFQTCKKCIKKSEFYDHLQMITRLKQLV